MPWVEPLSVASADHDAYSFTVTVRAGNGLAVAHVRCAVNVPAGCGVYGAMFIDAGNGGVRQRIRALALLTREALRHARALGITRVQTQLPARLRKFATALSGDAGLPMKGTTDILLRGSLADMLANAEARVAANGDVPSLTAVDITL
jgi:hypothetical protein